MCSWKVLYLADVSFRHGAVPVLSLSQYFRFKPGFRLTPGRNANICGVDSPVVLGDDRRDRLAHGRGRGVDLTGGAWERVRQHEEPDLQQGLVSRGVRGEQ